MPTQHRKCGDATGAALPGVLIVMAWLVGLTGWLVAHVAWTSGMQADETKLHVLGSAADAMASIAVHALDGEADWSSLAAGGGIQPCPGATQVAVGASQIAVETARVQAASDALARWPVGQRPTWRPWLGCDADALLGGWRGATPPPWVLALVADDPDGLLVAGLAAQVSIVAIAGSGPMARSQRTLTVRRSSPSRLPRIVGWRPG